MFTETALNNYVGSERFRRALQIPADRAVPLQFLAQGEYHRNYLFSHPVRGQELVLRVNFGSQMHLERQIAYEFETLRLLRPSGRTPEPLWVDEEGIDGHGVLVMEYIKGRPLDYGRDLERAAVCLAKIHGVSPPEAHHLLRSGNTAADILSECRQMFQVYQQSPLADSAKARWIGELLNRGEAGARNPLMEAYVPCCINTELNNTNFLVNDDTGEAKLIDWEKPLYGDPAQDLSHFLAPTTTFWKTDVILDRLETEAFLDAYINAAKGTLPLSGLRERVHILVPVTCLRGITWCAMAWVEYQSPDRQLRNASTLAKLGQYLEDGFLQLVDAQLSLLE